MLCVLMNQVSNTEDDAKDKGVAINENANQGSMLERQEEFEEILVEDKAGKERQQCTLNQPTDNLVICVETFEHSAKSNNVEAYQQAIHHHK